MDCSVCGQPGAVVCLAKDEHGNPIGDWVHGFCAPQMTIGTEACTLAGRFGSSQVSRGKRVAVPGVRVGRGHIVLPLTPRVHQASKGRGKLHKL